MRKITLYDINSPSLRTMMGKRNHSLLPILFFLLGPIIMTAQNVMPQLLENSTLESNGLIRVENGQFNLQLQANPTAGPGKITSMTIENADLIIQYQAAAVESNEYYLVNIEVITEKEGVIYPGPENLKADIGRIQPVSNLNRQIIWAGFLEQVFDPIGTINVRINLEHWGIISPIDCDNPPVFSAKEKRPYLIAAGTGLAMIGTGIVIKQQSNDIYDNQYFPEQDRQKAQPLYDDANGKHHTFLILTYGGLAVLATDAVFYLLRQARHKQQMRTFRQFCPEAGLTLRPVYENVAVLGQPYLGLKLGYKF